MASTTISPANALYALNPALQIQQQGALRQQALAEALIKQSQDPIDTNQSTGMYIANVSPMQGIGKIAQALAGRYIQSKTDEKQLAIAKQLQQSFNPGGENSNLTVPGMNPQQSYMMAATNGEGWSKSIMEANQAKANLISSGGMTPEQAQQTYAGQEVNKAIHDTKPASMYTNLATNQAGIAPDINTGTAGAFNQNGTPIMGSIPGAGAIANLAGEKSAATEAPKLMPTVNPDGSPTFKPASNYMLPNIPNPANSPTNHPLVTADQVIPAQGQPQGVPITPTPAQIDTQKKQADNAVTANQAYQKALADLAPVDAAINRMRSINKDVPYGSFHIGDLQADISNIPGFNHKSATNASEWDQLGSQGVLGGIKNLGMARADIPIINSVVTANGVPREDNPQARGIMLDNLQTTLHNRVASLKNAVQGMNTTQIPTMNPASMQPYGQNQMPQSQQMTPQTSIDPRIAIAKSHGYTDAQIAAYLQAKGGQ